jgi:hypothetical protein
MLFLFFAQATIDGPSEVDAGIGAVVFDLSEYIINGRHDDHEGLTIVQYFWNICMQQLGQKVPEKETR